MHSSFSKLHILLQKVARLPQIGSMLTGRGADFIIVDGPTRPYQRARARTSGFVFCTYFVRASSTHSWSKPSEVRPSTSMRPPFQSKT